MKFFRRKKKQEREEFRRHYRRVPGRKHALGVKASRMDGFVFSGEVHDLSAGGVAVTFIGSDPEFDAGDVLHLTFSSLFHGRQVVAAAVVRSRVESESESESEDVERTRYGFEFSDRQSLFEGLDPWFHKFFNRRREIRVRPALDTKLEVTLSADEREHDLSIHDVSTTGVGVSVGPDLMVWISETESFQAELKLLKDGGVYRAPALRVHMIAIRSGHRLGLQFDQTVGGVEAGQALTDYCKAREADMARWNSAYE